MHSIMLPQRAQYYHWWGWTPETVGVPCTWSGIICNQYGFEIQIDAGLTGAAPLPHMSGPLHGHSLTACWTTPELPGIPAGHLLSLAQLHCPVCAHHKRALAA